MCASVWVVPLITSSIAAGFGALQPVGGNWCWITRDRTDLRYALGHGWRFAIIIATIFVYAYIYIYIQHHFSSNKALRLSVFGGYVSTAPPSRDLGKLEVELARPNTTMTQKTVECKDVQMIAEVDQEVSKRLSQNIETARQSMTLTRNYRPEPDSITPSTLNTATTSTTLNPANLTPNSDTSLRRNSELTIDIPSHSLELHFLDYPVPPSAAVLARHRLQIKPFNPTVPQEEVDRLFRKLKDTRLPQYPIVPDSADNDDYGAPLDWARRLKEYWETRYDWNKVQKEISSWHHFKTHIEGIDIHFVHEKGTSSPSSSTKPIPLLLVHGWPGSFYEFSRVIKLLTTPSSSPDAPVFDVVVVSLPGFAWSGPPPRRGWTLQDSARVFDTLMGRLGYFSYCAQGGDWAHWVVRELGSGRFPACRVVHTNMCPSEPPVSEEMETEREKMARERLKWWLGGPGAEKHMGYAVEMRTRPQTLGIALNDSPVGIMMWVGEKYNELTDPQWGNLQDHEFNDHVVTTLCLYYFTGPSIMTSMLCYYENVRHEDYVEFNSKEENKIKVPMGFTSYKWDISPTSERSVATTGNVKWFKERDYGGHFAALETPQEMADDLRDLCGRWYSE
ncbi:hypothetical protein SLS57_001823 [Botryosphaeria dothidea]